MHALVATALVVCVGVLGLGGAAAAAPDSKGTEHWLMFTQNVTPPTMSLFVTSDVDTTGTMTIPGLGVSTPFSVTAGNVTTVPVPALAEVDALDLVQAKGIRVTAAAEVTVYGLSQAPATTDAFLGLPVDVLGTEHIVLGYRNAVPSPLTVPGTQFGVVATADDTAVTIVPSVTTGSRVAGVPYVVPMDAGETYQLRNTNGLDDLSGTVITSDKPVAVFGGHYCANVPPTVSFCDHLVEQLPPTSSWGESFVTMPLATRLNGDTFRFLASEDDTEITVNGVLAATLDRGGVHEQIITGAAVIQATGPILVAQYSNSTQFDNVTSDPFMMLIPPAEQYLADYTLTTPAVVFQTNFVNVVAPSAAVGSITVDGVPIPAADFSPIGASGFSGAQVAVGVGSHRLQGPLPFGVHAYGFAQADSYGYPGGAAFAPVAVVADVSLTPETFSRAVGTQHCVTAAVTDQNAAPLGGVRVDFAVAGPNATSGFAFTSSAGAAEFCYTGQAAGTDTITAAVGSVDDTATVTWTETPRPHALVLTPETATNVVDTEHCVTATVTDQFDAPFPDAPVAFTVSAPNPGNATVTTGQDGTARHCYTGTAAGTDTITAAVGQIQDTATKEWTPEPPRATTLTLEPPTATNVVDTEHCVTATLLDQRDDPMQGVAVGFTVSGTHTRTGSDATDPDGKARFCYTGTTPGHDSIEASVGTLKATASKLWTPEPARAATLTLAPKTATNVVGTQHCVTATVRDQRGDLFPGADVLFAVTGAHTTGGTVATGTNGEARFCWTGTTAGTDSIEASVGQIEDTATKTWTQPTAKRVFLVLDEDGRGKGKPLQASRPGDTLTLGSGQTGDEGWFAPTCIPRKWLGGSGDQCLEGQERDTAIDNVSGLNGAAAVPRGSRLDKVPAVMPLRALGLSSLVGKEVCAVSSSSDLSINYDSSSFPFTSANMQGTARGLVAFRVDAVVAGRGSSSSLPQVTVTVLDPAGCGDWELFNAPVPRSSSEPEDTRPDRPAGVGDKGYLQARVWPAKGLFF